MFLVETKPVVGELYGFNYTSGGGLGGSTTKKRLVLVQKVDNDGFFGHDFLANGSRKFKFKKIQSAKNFTDKVDVYSYDTVEFERGSVDEAVELYQDKGCLVYDDEDKELLYIVNYKG